MTATEARPGILERLDRLNEFERRPVAEERLHGGMYFAGTYAGEHVAATEFVIGALFVSWGATAFDVVVGLLLGNLFAVLSWALICAPIAVSTRLTLYWYVRKIAGPVVMVVYNVLNAVLYCVLAGCMITVAASAVRIPFGIEPQTGWLPTDPWFVPVVVGVGAVVVTLAIWGFKRLAQFASICSPWMLLMFVAGALVTVRELGFSPGFAGFWTVANESIWTGPAPGQTSAIGFWHVVAFAWICNLAMHVGLSDMALLRYAKRSWYGLYSAFGMYLGHYVAWICAGVMGAAVAKVLDQPLEDLDSGQVAFGALGATGAIAVVIAGWTTSNPTLYRAGLALQVVTPGWPRWLVTLIAGVITTATACFPFVFRHLLEFVGIYGLLLMPVGAIVVAEHWVFPRIGFAPCWSSRKGQLVNWPALAAWGLALTGAAWCWQTEVLHLFFLAVPVWLVTTVLYILFAGVAGAKRLLPELEVETAHAAEAAPVDAPASQPAFSPAARRIAWYAGGLALFCLATILAFSCCRFAEYIGTETVLFHIRTFGVTFNDYLLGATFVYFVSAMVWMGLRERRDVHATG